MDAEILSESHPLSGLEASGDVFRRIVVPVDFTEQSQVAMGLALDLKARFGSEVCAFNLIFLEEGGDVDRLGRERVAALIEAVQPGASQDVVVQICSGEDVARWIHDVVTAWRGSLVILGAHPRHMVFRSLAERMMRALKIPVLLLP